MKKCSKCKQPRNHEEMTSLCKPCYYEKQASKGKKKTRIPQVSEKKKKRLKEFWWEDKLHIKVADKREVDWLLTCEVCSRQFPREPMQAVSYAHILAKWMYPALRYFENNIAVVCPDISTDSCHNELDTLTAWNKLEIEKEIMNGKYIDIGKLRGKS